MTRKFKKIKSGYGAYDHYTVQITFDDEPIKHEIDFYYIVYGVMKSRSGRS